MMKSIAFKTYASSACLVVVVILFLSYGKSKYDKGYNAATAKISAELAKSAEKQRQQAHAISQEYQQEKAQREENERVRYVEIQKIVEKPIYHNVCLDDDGLRIINSAIKN